MLDISKLMNHLKKINPKAYHEMLKLSYVVGFSPHTREEGAETAFLPILC